MVSNSDLCLRRICAPRKWRSSRHSCVESWWSVAAVCPAASLRAVKSRHATIAKEANAELERPGSANMRQDTKAVTQMFHGSPCRYQLGSLPTDAAIHFVARPGGMISSVLRTTRPEPHLYASHNPVCAGIVDRFALLSEGGWDAFSKTPTASNSFICFRVNLHLEPKATRLSGAGSRLARALSFPCGGRCSRWDRWRNGNGKSDGNRRILLPSQRSESVGELVPAAPGNLADTIERRGSRLGARGRPHRFRAFSGDEQIFRGCPKGLDGELSSPGSRQNGGTATGRRNRDQD